MTRLRARTLEPEALLGRDLLAPTSAARRIRARMHGEGDPLESHRVRVYTGTGIALVAIFTIVVRLSVVMVPLGGGDETTRRVAAAVERPRAEIVDRNGIVLARDLVSSSVYADPRAVRDASALSARLADVLPELDTVAMTRLLARDKSFVWVRRHITPREAEAVNRLGEPGIKIVSDRQRVYPAGGLAPHIVGITDLDRRGVSGIELAYEEQLTSTDAPVVLSIDASVQHALERELDYALTRFSGIGAAGVVLDAHSGEVLALASLPEFNPRDRRTLSDEAVFNRAAKGVYEFGSVFKSFTYATALERRPDLFLSEYDISEPVRVGRYRITDYRSKKQHVTFTEAFAVSSNIGTVGILENFGKENLLPQLKTFGLTEALPLEVSEIGKPYLPKTWRDDTSITASYGHGISVSPLHVARAAASLVNGGILPETTLLKRPDGALPSGQRVLAPETSAAMRRLFRLAVLDGTGRNANAKGYRVGGKTGTANKLDPDGTYSATKRISSFLAAFPMEAPRFVVFIMVDEPKGREDTLGFASGGWVAAPATRRLVERIAPLLGVMPRDTAARDAETLALLAPTRESVLRTTGLDATPRVEFHVMPVSERAPAPEPVPVPADPVGDLLERVLFQEAPP